MNDLPTQQHKNRRDLIALALAAPVLGACDIIGESWTLRYRLKIRIACDGKSYEGASVFKTRYTRRLRINLNRWSEYYAQAWGEAVVVDCGPKGLVFGLLEQVWGINYGFDPNREQTLIRLLPREQYTSDDFLSGRVFALLKNLKGEQDVSRETWPVLVRFENNAVPESIKVLTSVGDTAKYLANMPVESMSIALGDGAYVERVTVEITGAKVTHQIEKVLPWVRNLQGGDGAWTQNPAWPLSKNLLQTNFKMVGNTR